MTTIKSFTDISQSKKLVEILPLESADMYYLSGDECDICLGSGVYEEIANWLSDGTPRPADIPCWSFASLLNVLPDNYVDINDTIYHPNLMKTKDGRYMVIYNVSLCTSLYNNPVDACYEMIIRLNELKML